jgi:hypothetical protein
MSGLDPLGRRDVQALILRLRTATASFSSHVLSDAEALCSRVTIWPTDVWSPRRRPDPRVQARVGAGHASLAGARRRRGPDRWCAGRCASGTDATRWAAARSGTRAPGGATTAEGARLISLNPIRDTGGLFRRRVSTRQRPRAPGTPGAASWRHAAIALNVFRESVRDKVLYNLVFFAILMIGASYLIGQLTAGQDVKIIKDIGLSATSVFGLFIAVFIGIGLVSKEVERRSAYSLLAKPIHRYQMIAGKYAGLTLTLAVNVAIMAMALYAVLAFMRWGVPANVQQAWDAPALDPAMLKALILILFELMIVTAIALFFSTFSTPILSAAFTFGLFIIGHFSTDLRNIGQVVSRRPRRLAKGCL